MLNIHIEMSRITSERTGIWRKMKLGGGEWNQSIQNKEAKEKKEKEIQKKQEKYY